MAVRNHFGCHLFCRAESECKAGVQCKKLSLVWASGGQLLACRCREPHRHSHLAGNELKATIWALLTGLLKRFGFLKIDRYRPLRLHSHFYLKILSLPACV